MAGLTEAGFETKRLTEIVTELQSNAQTVFQDLVPVGDIVDTSASSTIGRFINLFGFQFSDLWELAQQVYAAFDPNSSSGIALDNLVALNGTVRRAASSTRADAVVWGNQNVNIPEGVQLKAVNGDEYTIEEGVTLNLSENIGLILTLPSVVTGTTYSLSITRANTTLTYSKTATGSDTVATILNYFYTQISSSAFFNSSVTATELRIESASIYVSLSVVTNFQVNKIKARAKAVNVVTGALPLDANSLNTILTPILGWDSVTNPFIGVVGDEEETDDELRARFSLNKYISAININESLYSALINIDSVQEVRIVENNTNAYVAEFDLPGHSFKPIVLGGGAADIAQAIWLNQPLGISSEGNTEYEITDSQGFPHTIKFERPEPVPIYISMEIESTGDIPATAETTIKASLIEYFSKMKLGEEIVYSRLFTPINETEGFQINDLTMGTSPSPTGKINIGLDYNQYATISSDNIDITIV